MADSQTDRSRCQPMRRVFWGERMVHTSRRWDVAEWDYLPMTYTPQHLGPPPVVAVQRCWRNYTCNIRVKGKSDTFDIACLSEGTLLQKCSGMARVVDIFHHLTCTPMRLSTNVTYHTCLCLPCYSWSSFENPGGNEGRVGLGTVTVSKQSAVMAITVVSCLSHHASLGNWSITLTNSSATSRDTNHWATHYTGSLLAVPSRSV